MPSSIVVTNTKITDILPHPNADKLEIVVVKGWQVISQIGLHKIGDYVIYVPPETVVPIDIAKELGVDKYLSLRKNIEPDGRTKAVRLRGEMSFGFIFKQGNTTKCLKEKYDDEQDVADIYGFYKYEEPEKLVTGNQEKDHPLFFKYTNIENFRNYPDRIPSETVVVVTQKIHGTNARYGLVKNDDGKLSLIYGTHKTVLKNDSENTWNKHFSDNVKELLHTVQIFNDASSVILFGEIYGSGIQKGYTYDIAGSAFKAFDICIDGKYLDFNVFRKIADDFYIDVVDVLDIDKFEIIRNKIPEYANFISYSKHEQEGVVIRPYNEMQDRLGRVILKYHSDEWLIKNTR